MKNEKKTIKNGTQLGIETYGIHKRFLFSFFDFYFSIRKAPNGGYLGSCIDDERSKPR